MTEMYFCLLRMGIGEESIWKLRSLPYAIWFLWNLSRIFNGMPHCSIIPLIRARENGSAMACVNLWLKTLRLSLSCHHPFLHPSLSLHSSFTSNPFFFGFFLSFRLGIPLTPHLSLLISPSSHSLPLRLIATHRSICASPLVLFPPRAAALWSIVCAFRRAHLNTFYLVWSVSASCCPF